MKTIVILFSLAVTLFCWAIAWQSSIKAVKDGAFERGLSPSITRNMRRYVFYRIWDIAFCIIFLQLWSVL